MRPAGWPLVQKAGNLERLQKKLKKSRTFHYLILLLIGVLAGIIFFKVLESASLL
jgi:hypothetical protein